MGWLGALGQSWLTEQDRFAQQRELDRKWKMQEAQNAREEGDFATRQRINQLAILKDEHGLRRQPVVDQQNDQLFGLDVEGKRAGIRRDTLGADTSAFTLGRGRVDAGREDQFYQWMQQNPDVKPEEALMAAARFGVDASKTAGLSAKLNTDLQREQMRTQAAIQAAALRGPYGGRGSMTQPSEFTESLPDKFRRESATADLKRMPLSVGELMEARKLEAVKAADGADLTPEALATLNKDVAGEWGKLEPQMRQRMTDAMPDTVQGDGFAGAEGMSPTFTTTSRDLIKLVAANGPQMTIDNIADEPSLTADEKEMLRQQVVQLASIFGAQIDPDYRPKVYREPYGTQPATPQMGFSQRYMTRR